MPAAGGTVTARDLVMKLGAFLAELTSDRSAAEVHAGIVARLSEPDHDPRLAGAGDADRFAAMTAALGSDSSLPEEAWPGVVLPTVVAFSPPNELKANLELATALWMAASTAVNGPSQALAGTGALPEPEPELVDSTAFPAAGDYDWPPSVRSGVEVVDGSLAPAPVPRRRRPVIPAVVAAALIVAALVWWTRLDPATDGSPLSVSPSMPAGGGGQSAVAIPGASAQAVNSPPPVGSAPVGNVVPLPPSMQPVPAPTWNGPGPIVAPTAPRDLAASGSTETTVTLRWEPPADAGTGGLAYYRIWRDGTDLGWTPQSSATVLGLTAATSYTFTVTAHNGAGAVSPPSNPVIATTRQSQPQQPTPTTPQTGPPAANPLLATDPPQKAINLGRSFTVTGSGWPCSAPATINLYLGGKLVAAPEVSAQGAFRTTIAVDATDPQAPTVAVIGGSERLTLTRGIWVLAARLPAQPSCSDAADQSIQIEFRTGPR